MHLLIISIFLGATSGIFVPRPPGLYSVASNSFEVIDLNRVDPFAPEPNTKRKFMVSAYMPIDECYDCKAQVVPYMPPGTAAVFDKYGERLTNGIIPQGFLENFEMEFCNISTVDPDKNRRKKKFPVAMFSPGYGASRLLYGALARSVASHGYIVFTIDHPYDALVVEFPNKALIYNNRPSNVTTLESLLEVEVRAADVSSLVSQLSNTTFTDSVFHNFPGTFCTDRIAVYGHSLGGSTAALSAQRDPRVIGGANIDGPIRGSVGEQGLKRKPFFLIASEANLENSLSGLNWDNFYPKIDALKMQLAVKNTTHDSFTDVPLLLTAFPLPPATETVIDEVFGTINGRDDERAIDEIMVGVLELLFHRKKRLLKNIGEDANIEVLKSDLSNR